MKRAWEYVLAMWEYYVVGTWLYFFPSRDDGWPGDDGPRPA